jgi:hypothetical protein
LLRGDTKEFRARNMEQLATTCQYQALEAQHTELKCHDTFSGLSKPDLSAIYQNGPERRLET